VPGLRYETQPTVASTDVRPLLRPFLELEIAMAVGALVCLFVGNALRASGVSAIAYRPGTPLYLIGDVLFLTVPVVVWMSLRGHGWLHGIELAAAMLAPVAAIIVVGEVGQGPYMLWLITAMYPAMSLGMAVYIVSRRQLFNTPRALVGRVIP